MSDTTYISPSKLSTLAKCEVLYDFQYVQKRPRPVGPSPSAVVGRALHAGAELDLAAVATKIAAGAPREGADVPLPEVLDAAADAFDRAARGENEWRKEDGTVERTDGPPPPWETHETNPGREKDAAVRKVTPAWYSGIAPSVIPAAVERSASLELVRPDGSKVILSGRLDVLPVDGVVADLKHTAGYNFASEADAETDDQLTAYDLLYRAATGKVPVSLGFDTVRLRKPKNGEGKYSVSGIARPRVSPRSEAVVRRFLARVDRDAARIEALRAGAVPPRAANPGDWWCSKKWCSYWTICPFGGA